uniref:C2H2-type domain-containing protein n=1 Tax=Riboviria sp. TaxID=2585031 RepID=A0A8K1U3N9_9VIRU|nr:MAG: hypothetical protein 2 [Riboviria sp.]
MADARINELEAEVLQLREQLSSLQQQAEPAVEVSVEEPMVEVPLEAPLTEPVYVSPRAGVRWLMGLVTACWAVVGAGVRHLVASVMWWLSGIAVIMVVTPLIFNIICGLAMRLVSRSWAYTASQYDKLYDWAAGIAVDPEPTWQDKVLLQLNAFYESALTIGMVSLCMTAMGVVALVAIACGIWQIVRKVSFYVQTVQVYRPECMQPGSLFSKASCPKGQIAIVEPGVFGATHVGWATRVSQCVLVTVHHNLIGREQRFALKTDNPKAQVKQVILEGATIVRSKVDTDLSFIILDANVLSKLSLGIAPLARSLIVGGLATCFGGNGVSTGALRASSVHLKLQFDGSTLPGMSGSPYRSGDLIVGFHQGVINHSNIGIPALVVRKELEKLFPEDPTDQTVKAVQDGPVSAPITIDVDGKSVSIGSIAPESKRGCCRRFAQTGGAEHSSNCSKATAVKLARGRTTWGTTDITDAVEQAWDDKLDYTWAAGGDLDYGAQLDFGESAALVTRTQQLLGQNGDGKVLAMGEVDVKWVRLQAQLKEHASTLFKLAKSLESVTGRVTALEAKGSASPKAEEALVVPESSKPVEVEVEVKYPCEHCGQVQNGKEKLENHIKQTCPVVHKKVRHNCKYCPASFKDPSLLQRHVAKHNILRGESATATDHQIEVGTKPSSFLGRRPALMKDRSKNWRKTSGLSGQSTQSQCSEPSQSEIQESLRNISETLKKLVQAMAGPNAAVTLN